MILFTPSLNRVLSNLGQLASGAKLYIYYSETEDLAPSYTDPSGDTLAANPLVANGVGLFDPLYLDMATRYRAKLTTSDGAVVIFDAELGALDLTFMLDATGAVSRTINSRLAEEIHVTDFGAVGDGVTDDAAAIQAAFNHAGTLVSTGSFYIGQIQKPHVIFPAGMRFKITSAVTCPNGVNVTMLSPIEVSASASTGNSWLKIGTTLNTQGTRGGFLYLDVVRSTASDWTNANDVGIELQGFAASDITIARCIGFRVGLLTGAGGNCFGYNIVKLGEIRGNKRGVLISCDTGYFNNQNQWFGGEFANIADGVSGQQRSSIEFKASPIAGYEDHLFIGQSHELGVADAGGSGNAIPVLINGTASSIIFKDQRSENCSDVKMSIGSGLEVTRCEFNERYTQRDSSTWPGIVGGGISDGSLHKTNKTRSYMDELLKDALLVFDSGDLGLVTNPYDGAGGAKAVGGFDIADSAYTLLAGRDLIAASGNVLTFSSAGRNLFRQIDTTTNKRFIILVNTGDITKTWNFALKPFDASGTLLSDNPTPPHIVGEDNAFLSWNGGSVGGAYVFTGSQKGRAFYFNVDSATKSVGLGFLGDNGLQLRSIQIYALDAPCSTWATTRSLKSDTDLIATSVPTTGTWQQGVFIWNVAPSISSGKILLGWSRLTTGSGNVAGTDWSPIYGTTS